MSEMIVLEVRFFLGSFLSGILLVAAYDILRFLRRLIPHSRTFVNGEDILFWSGASMFIFRVIYRLNNGSIRGFGLLCMAAGMLLYHFSLSNVLVEFFYRVFGTSLLKFTKMLKKGLKKLGKPFRIGICRLKKLFRRKHEDRQKGDRDS